jgi:hypothetical protein
VLTCPVCESPQVLVALSPPRRAACRECGARWAQEDGSSSGAGPSTIPNVIGVIRPDSAETALSITQVDPRS